MNGIDGTSTVTWRDKRIKVTLVIYLFRSPTNSACRLTGPTLVRSKRIQTGYSNAFLD